MVWSIVQGAWTLYTLIGIVVAVLAAVIAVTVHGVTQARVARALGDRTADDQNMTEPDPREHFDPIGSTAVVLFGWGWGKTVPFYPGRGRYERRDMILFALSGPAANLLLAVLLSLFLRFLFVSSDILAGIFAILIYINLGLAFFSLLPFPPLDGLKVILEVLPPRLSSRYARFMDRWGFLILLALVFLLRGALVPVIDRPLMVLLTWLTGMSGEEFSWLLTRLS